MRTQKISQKLFIFLKTQKILKFKILDPQKMTRAYVCLKISEYPPPPPPPRFIRPIYPTDQGYFLTQSWFEMHPLLYVHAQLSEWDMTDMHVIYFVYNSALVKQDMTDMHVIYFVYNSALVKQIFIPFRKGKHPIAPGPGPARPIPYKYFKTPSIQILYHCSSDRLLSGGYAVTV